MIRTNNTLSFPLPVSAVQAQPLQLFELCAVGHALEKLCKLGNQQLLAKLVAGKVALHSLRSSHTTPFPQKPVLQ
eukprot:2884159-Rhodomonas_salina.1